MHHRSSGRYRVIFYFFLCLFLIPSCTGRYGKRIEKTPSKRGTPPAVKVLLKKGILRLNVGVGHYRLSEVGGGEISSGEKPLVIDVAPGDRIRAGKRAYGGDLIFLSENGVSIDGTLYRGTLILHVHDGGISIVEKVSLEEYVKGVLKKEVPSSFSFEALKALAVAIRTYTLYRREHSRGNYFYLDSSNLSQVYGGGEGIEKVYADAVKSTRGIVVTYQGQIALTVYHSTCGGKTERASNVWEKDHPYLRSVKCDYGRRSPFYRWTYATGQKSFLKGLKSAGVRGKVVRAIRVLSATDTGRAKKVTIRTELGKWVIHARGMRAAIGYRKLRSLSFTVKKEGSRILFRGRGYGHGVGLCQYGADGLARIGDTYRNIIHFYYGDDVRFARSY